MSVREEIAYPLLRKHDVDYVLVIFGGLIGFSGDDINKFLWMVRISEGIWPDEVTEQKYFTSRGEYRVDDQASETMRNSLMYKMSYYRFVFFSFFVFSALPCVALCPRLTGDTPCPNSFNELYGGGPAQDRVRGQTIPPVPIKLDTLGSSRTRTVRMIAMIELTPLLAHVSVEEAFTSENWIVSACSAPLLPPAVS